MADEKYFEVELPEYNKVAYYKEDDLPQSAKAARIMVEATEVLVTEVSKEEYEANALASELIHRSDYRKVPIFKSIWVWAKSINRDGVPEWYTIERIGLERGYLLAGVVFGVALGISLTFSAFWLLALFLGIINITF